MPGVCGEGPRAARCLLCPERGASAHHDVRGLADRRHQTRGAAFHLAGDGIRPAAGQGGVAGEHGRSRSLGRIPVVTELTSASCPPGTSSRATALPGQHPLRIGLQPTGVTALAVFCPVSACTSAGTGASDVSEAPNPGKGCDRGRRWVSRCPANCRWGGTMTEHAPRIDFANLPAATESVVVTLFITVRKVARSRDFYSRVLGGTVVLEENPCIVKLSNSWIIMNPGGPPTPDKPGISVVDYQPGDTTSIFLN